MNERRHGLVVSVLWACCFWQVETVVVQTERQRVTDTSEEELAVSE